MEKEFVDVPVVSDLIRKVGAPLSPVVRANGFGFVSGLPGIDLATGRIVDGSIEERPRRRWWRSSTRSKPRARRSTRW